MSHICITYVCIHPRREANWKLKGVTESSGDTVSGAGSGMCELTNRRRLGSLKETGAKTEGQCEAAAPDSRRKLKCFLRIKECKPV